MVITGAAGGLGQAITRRFAAAGCRLGLLDLDGEGAARIAGTVETDAVGIGCDLTDRDQTTSAIAEVVEQLGPIEVLVNNAGITHRSAFGETDPTVIKKVMDVNYLGSVHATSAALPWLMDTKGAIAVVTSVAGFAPILGRAGYVGSKHALHGLFSVLRAELRPGGVDVTILAPTFVSTGLADRALGADGTITTHPQSRIGREVTPESVAERLYVGLEKRQRMVVVGSVGRIARVMTALAPGLYERLMARALKSELDR